MNPIEMTPRYFERDPGEPVLFQDWPIHRNGSWEGSPTFELAEETEEERLEKLSVNLASDEDNAIEAWREREEAKG